MNNAAAYSLMGTLTIKLFTNTLFAWLWYTMQHIRLFKAPACNLFLMWIVIAGSPKETNRLCNNLCLTLSILYLVCLIIAYNLVLFFCYIWLIHWINNFGLVFRASLVLRAFLETENTFCYWLTVMNVSFSVCFCLPLSYQCSAGVW